MIWPGYVSNDVQVWHIKYFILLFFLYQDAVLHSIVILNYTFVSSFEKLFKKKKNSQSPFSNFNIKQICWTKLNFFNFRSSCPELLLKNFQNSQGKIFKKNLFWRRSVNGCFDHEKKWKQPDALAVKPKLPKSNTTSLRLQTALVWNIFFTC